MSEVSPQPISVDTRSRTKSVAVAAGAVALIVALFVIIGVFGHRGTDEDEWIIDEYLASINHPALSDYKAREHSAEVSMRRANEAEVTIFGHVVEDADLSATELERLRAATPDQREEFTRVMNTLTQDLNAKRDARIRLETAREANKRAALDWYYVTLPTEVMMEMQRKHSGGR
jgi:hypothetical protein